MKELKIDLRLEAYVVVIDKNDFDFVIFFDKEKKDLQVYVDFVKAKFPNDFAYEIKAERYELWIDMNSNLKNFENYSPIKQLICDDNYPTFNYILGDFKKWFCDNQNDIVLKLIEEQNFKMPLNEKNKFEKLADDWDEIKDCLFGYNGAVWYVNEHMLYKMREFLDELENEIQKEQK